MKPERKKFQIADLKIALKDMEPYIKNGWYLIKGKRFENFDMLPREAWANWLLCATLSRIYGDEYTFQEEDNGDGVIFRRSDKKWFSTEHVAAMDFPQGTKLSLNEDRALWAINHKIKKDEEYTNQGKEYAKGKTLVVFMDGAQRWFPNKVGRQISKNNFTRIFCIALISGDASGYKYSISEFNPTHSPTYEIHVNSDFTDWKVIQIQ